MDVHQDDIGAVLGSPRRVERRLTVARCPDDPQVGRRINYPSQPLTLKLS